MVDQVNQNDKEFSEVVNVIKRIDEKQKLLTISFFKPSCFLSTLQLKLHVNNSVKKLPNCNELTVLNDRYC